MSKLDSDTPDVRVVPPLVYLVGLCVGLLISVWMPITVVSNLLAWLLGGVLFLCGAVLAGSAVLRFASEGTTVRPDRAANKFVVEGPYRITRNPMYLGLAIAYLGITIADQSLWALLLFPVVLLIIQRAVIEHEEAFLTRRFGADYLAYKERVRRWL
jgi:protein-S-isoprenylcysteine O-methyltransferase Ste14